MKQKTRLVLCVLFALLILSSVVALSACEQKCNHQWADATCLSPRKCKLCGLEDGPLGDHSGGHATCSTQAVCDVCHSHYGDVIDHNWVATSCSEPKVCSMCGAIDYDNPGHIGGIATCLNRAVCSVCGNEYGELAPHVGGTATCEHAAKCDVCGREYGEPAKHDWVGADCESPRRCTVCGTTDGQPLGHIGGTATCEHLAVCTYCGSEYGKLADHKGGVATCEHPATCVVCGNEYGSALSHSWVAATCVEPKTCSACGHTEGNPLGHNWGNSTEIVASTCTTGGKLEYECKTCHTTKEENISSLGHSYTVTVQNATCTEGGYTTHTCTRKDCGDTYQDNFVAALGHDWDNPTRTCELGQSCRRCDASTLPLGHNYQLTNHVGATCTTSTKNTYTCGNCSNSYVETLNDATGHNFAAATYLRAELVVGTSCEYSLIYRCPDCRQEISDKAHNVMRHSYIATVTTEATCTTEGVKTVTCRHCNASHTETIAVNTSAHTWDVGILEGSIRTQTCLHCSQTKSFVDATGVTTASVDKSTLADVSLKLETAEIALDQNTINSLKGSGEIAISATMLSDSDMRSILSKMDEDKQQQLGSNPIYNFTMMQDGNVVSDFGNGKVTVTLPYTLSEGEDVDSIAIWYINADGRPETIEASYCNGFVTFQTNHFSYYAVTAMTPSQRCDLYGHNYSERVTDVTCSTDGYTLKICLRCGKSEISDIVTRLGHNYNETVITPATCTTDGQSRFTCENCNKYYTVKVPATGHDWNVVESVAATCLTTGFEKSVCSVCGENHEEVVAQLMHNLTSTVVAATCETDGYTTHVCADCQYSYDDEQVKALGHSYVESWTWTGFDSAKLVLTCERDSSHVVNIDAEIVAEEVEMSCYTPAGTLYHARVEHNGILYTDILSDVGTELAPHTYSEKWIGDASGHWHECVVCGSRSEVENHVLDGMMCSVCGMEHFDCDHTLTVEHRIDFADYGCCGGYVLYYSCLCGENIQLEDGQFDCDDFVTTEESSYTDVDGFNHMDYTAVCPVCGLTMVQKQAGKSIGCNETGTNYAALSINGEILFELEEPYSYERHEWRDNYINLETRCGGEIHVTACAACGKQERCEIYLYNCKMEIVRVDEYEGDGVSYRYEESVCSRCGIVQGITTAYRTEGCSSFVTTTVKITSDNGDVIFEGAPEERHYDNHQYIYNREFLGQTCEEGVIVTTTCANCELHYTHTYYGHSLTRESANLSDYGCCDGVMEYERCENCDYREINRLNPYNCHLTEYSTDEYIDENGNVHNARTVQCTRCGLFVTEDRYTVVLDDCHYSVYFITRYELGEVNIATIENWDHRATHDNELTFEMFGSSCDDGYIITRTCKICGEVTTEECHGHYWDGTSVDLSELGMCGGTWTHYTCAICNEDLENYVRDIRCNWVEEERNENQVIYRCSACGAQKRLTSEIEDDGCLRITTQRNAYVIDGLELAVETHRYHEWMHNWEFSYELFGSSCDDGYTVTEYCTKCGESNTFTQYEHNQRLTQKFDLDEFGACEGNYIYIYQCACGEYSHVENRFHEDNRTSNSYADGNGVIHYVELAYCYQCKLTVQTDSYTVHDNEACLDITYTQGTIAVNGTAVGTYSTRRTESAHNYVVSTELQGSDCEQGVVITRACSQCGYSYSDTYYYHYSYEQERLNLKDYGATCEGYISLIGCACGREFSINRDNALCNFDDQWTEQWITDALPYVSYCDVDGCWYGYTHEARLWVCSVSEPECGFAIRYASFYRQVPGECAVKQNIVWQIGYDRDTDTYQREISFEYPYVYTYHQFTEKEISFTQEGLNVSGTLKTCDVCGSTIRTLSYCDKNGQEVKRTVEAHNVSDILNYKDYNSECRFIYNNGRQYTSYNNITYTFADGSQHTDTESTQYDFTYVAPFGENSYAYVRNESNGCISENKITYYMGHDYIVYSKVTNREGDWWIHNYEYDFAGGCICTDTWTSSYGENNTTTYTCHQDDNYVFEEVKAHTCTQWGECFEGWHCSVCDQVHGGNRPWEPIAHSWTEYNGHYICTICQLESKVGASGEIVMEDLTDQYGNDTHYVVGYLNRSGVQFGYQVTLLLSEAMSDGTDQVVLLNPVVNRYDSSDIVAVTLSKEDIALLAAAQLAEMGYYGDYTVKLSFVPDYATSEFDYSITFGDYVG